MYVCMYVCTKTNHTRYTHGVHIIRIRWPPRIHTCISAYMHTYTPTTQIYTHIHSHVYVYIYIHTNKDVYMHTSVYSFYTSWGFITSPLAGMLIRNSEKRNNILRSKRSGICPTMVMQQSIICTCMCMCERVCVCLCVCVCVCVCVCPTMLSSK
jgi:hypothetical protein